MIIWTIRKSRYVFHREQYRNKRCKTSSHPGQQKQQNPPHASNIAERRGGIISATDAALQNGINLKTAIKETGSNIGLRRFMTYFVSIKSRFLQNSFQEALKCRNENFGKIRQSLLLSVCAAF